MDIRADQPHIIIHCSIKLSPCSSILPRKIEDILIILQCEDDLFTTRLAFLSSSRYASSMTIVRLLRRLYLRREQLEGQQ